MRAFIIFLISLGASLNLIFAQVPPQNPNQTDSLGKKQGRWTILYDLNGEIVQDTSWADLYRVLTYQHDRPIGQVEDYYLNGQLQMHADSLMQEAPDQYHGEVTFFREDGSKDAFQKYENGKLSEETLYDRSGHLVKENWRSLLSQALKNYETGNYREALELFKKAKTQAKEEYGAKHLKLAQTCYLLGFMYSSLGKYEQALAEYREASEVAKTKPQKSYTLVANLHNGRASIYQYQGDYRRAVDGFQKALSRYREAYGKNHFNVAILHNNLGQSYYEQGKYTLALQEYEKAKEIFLADQEQIHPKIAETYHNLGAVYTKQGDYERALVQYEKSQEIFLTTYGKTHPLVAISYNNMGDVYSHLGDYELAIAQFETALAILLAIYGDNHPNTARTYGNLGHTYYSLKDYAQASDYYQKALEIFSANYGENHPLVATTRGNLGSIHKHQKKYELASTQYQKALKIRLATLGKNHGDVASSYNSLGTLYYLQGVYQSAVEQYQKALAINLGIYDETHPEIALNYSNLGLAYDDQGEDSLAYEAYQVAAKSLLNQVKKNFPNLSQRGKTLFFQTLKDNFENFSSFVSRTYEQIPELTGWLYDLRLATKGLLFESSQKIRRRILNSGDSTLIQEFQEWQNQREHLAYVYTLSQKEKQKRGIDQAALEEKANRLEKELSQKSEFFAQTTDTVHYTSWRDVQKTLQPGEAAIEIIRNHYLSREKKDSILYLALIIKSTTIHQPEIVILPQGKDLEGKFLANYNNRIVAQSRDLLSYSSYWQPIAQKLGDIKKVYFSADGVYHLINLNILENPSTGKYLLEEIDIQLVSNTKDLIKPRKMHDFSQTALLIGRPVYNLEIARHQEIIQDYQERNRNLPRGLYTSNNEITRTMLSDLPGTELEVRQISQQLEKAGWQPRLYLKEKALEEVIKQSPHPQVLHIATHGFFSLPSESDSLREQDRASIPERMLRAGLLLTGVSSYAQNPSFYERNIEDGFLTAYEAMNLDLDHTELVVLSACETGKGEIQSGEGVYGLQRGFQQAGAQSVLISLWKVDDEATQALMTRFYQHWIGKKQNKRLAFRQAQLEMKAEYKYPYYWGAFVMVGQ